MYHLCLFYDFFKRCFVAEMLYVIWSFVLYRQFETRVVLQRVYIYSFVKLLVGGDDLINCVNMMVLWV